ncbi:hypothetical protein XELAEV_18010752mg [Xenopus laevis]|uniref:GIY-YIG domain-containing protein n=1 Tax=Xenopus laevis TaxID=8355 RepID=A0A974DXB3_XENLA|nr:hypothetical protein XELAEV_18010752mg [Xenopus laevis]
MSEWHGGVGGAWHTVHSMLCGIWLEGMALALGHGDVNRSECFCSGSHPGWRRSPVSLRHSQLPTDIAAQEENSQGGEIKRRSMDGPRVAIFEEERKQSFYRVQIPGTIEEYYIHGHYTCSSSNVVYAITCTKCPTRGIYIGETGQSLRKRTNHHRFTINNKKLDTPVGEHFNSPNHSLGDFQISVIKGNFKTENERKVWEYKLMQTFRSLETGLNLGHGFMANYQD